MKNRIIELREARGLSSRALAKRLGTSPSQMSRLENGERKLSLEWILRLSGVLDVPPNEIVDIDLGTSVPVSCDQALMGTVVGLLFDGCERFGAKPSAKEISSWITFVYNDAVQRKLTFPQVRELTETIVKMSKNIEKPEPRPDAGGSKTKRVPAKKKRS